MPMEAAWQTRMANNYGTAAVARLSALRAPLSIALGVCVDETVSDQDVLDRGLGLHAEGIGSAGLSAVLLPARCVLVDAGVGEGHALRFEHLAQARQRVLDRRARVGVRRAEPHRS